MLLIISYTNFSVSSKGSAGIGSDWAGLDRTKALELTEHFKDWLSWGLRPFFVRTCKDKEEKKIMVSFEFNGIVRLYGFKYQLHLPLRLYPKINCRII